ncbi:MAG: T9SS type A sorting domain-containing protein [Bacteroidia bacterium]|nr:T9SS type A sorting domain-containing protein [Bacteroidia bacterium]MBT8276439.1 T9SS type A sorting domain-containing protein [Bacteroidia bacterium]NNF30363.1 T9SS type A sorting domain-containing protein [Flavobacteriaceae bacterium]NNK53492.1 T9SS type A sorting domain-containing protein [Flavobacteriaceae bacterium]NNM08724.1 T9SS type A sorting domain-containing protein [Flavobacteriaceae bacterium]
MKINKNTFILLSYICLTILNFKLLIMKKITLLSAAFLVSAFGFAQTETYVSETGGINDPVVYVNQNGGIEADCSLSGPGNAFENGKSCTQNLGRIVAHDFVVAADEDGLLEVINANVFIGGTGSGVNAAFVDVYVWGDAGGAPDPGNLITSELGFVPDNQVVVGTNFGFDVWDLTLDITDVALPGQSGVATSYWIGLSVEATDASNLFWENSTAGLIGAGEAYDDGGGGGFVIDNTLEGVYTFDVECEPILGVGDNLAELVSIYPNPATTRINIQVPGNIEITNVALYDVLGKNTGATLVNGSVDVSNLAQGVYILNIQSNRGTLTQKIVKR